MKIDKKELVLYIVLVLVLLFSFFLDQYVDLFKDGVLFLDLSFSLITYLGHFVIAFIIFGIILFRKKEFKQFVLSFLIAHVIGVVLKLLIQRPRPFQEVFYPFLNLADYSFPSGHSISIVVGLLFLDKVYPRFRLVWVVVGVIVMFSRVYLGFHYFSDIVMGGIVAYLVTKYVVSKWSLK